MTVPTPAARAGHGAGRIAANLAGAAACLWWLISPSVDFSDLLPAALAVVLAVAGAAAFIGATGALIARQPWLEIGCLAIGCAVILAHAAALIVAPGLDVAALVAMMGAASCGQRVLDVLWLLGRRVCR